MKRIVTILLAIIVCILVVVTPFGTEPTAKAAGNFTVVINPGHGPISPGASVGSIRENVLNEQIAYKTAKTLQAQGITVYLTNKLTTIPNDIPYIIPGDPNPNNSYGGKQYDFQMELLPAINTPWVYRPEITRVPDLVMTLHHNDSGSGYPSSPKGYEIYYSQTLTGTYNKTETTISNSATFANLLDTQFRSGFYLTPRSPSIKTEEKNSITKYSGVPSVLIEAGFMTNAGDLVEIQKAENQQTLANKITTAVLQYAATHTRENDPPILLAATSSDTLTYVPQFSMSSQIYDVSGVVSAQYSVYPEALGKGSAKIYQASNYGDDWWHLYFDAYTDFQCYAGKYIVELSATDKWGNTGQLFTCTYTLLKDSAPPTAEGIRTSDLVTNNNYFRAEALGVKDVLSGVKKVRFAAWSEASNQADLKWYDGILKDGIWYADINAIYHNNAVGPYQVHVYAMDNQGNEGCIGTTRVTIGSADRTPPKGLGISTSENPTCQTKFTLKTGITDDDSGVASAKVAIWSEASNQADLKWYNLKQAGGNNWAIDIDMLKEFAGKPGAYQAHIYATDNAGNTGCIGTARLVILKDTTPPTASAIFTSGSPTVNPYFSVQTYKLKDENGIKNVRFAVWSEASNQADLKWIPGIKGNDGDWYVNVFAKDFGNVAGAYQVHVYATDTLGNEGCVGTTRVVMDFKDTVPPKGTGITLSENPTYKSQISLAAGITDDKSGVASARVAVWSEASNQADLKWYNLKQDGSNTWTLDIDMSKEFGGKIGAYQMHVYATDSAGNTGCVGTTRLVIQQDKTAPIADNIFTSGSPTVNPYFSVETYNLRDDESGIKNVRFAVWSEASNQADLKWYDGIRSGEGVWYANIFAKDHNNQSGAYQVHVYATNNQGLTACVGTTRVVMDFKDTIPPTGKLTDVSPSSYDTLFSMTANVTDDKTGVANVQVAVWSEASNQADLKWYDLAQGNDGNWAIDIDLKEDFGGKPGAYQMHVYAQDRSGNRACIGTVRREILKDTTPPQATAVAPSVSSTEDTEFSAYAYNVTDTETGVKNVRFAVWSEVSNQNDLVWYDGVNFEGENWKADIPIKNHNWESGIYQIHVYATNNQGLEGCIGTTSIRVIADTAPPTATKVGTAEQDIVTADFYMHAYGVQDKSGVKNVEFAVWSANGGQADLKWYDGQVSEDGTTWTAIGNVLNGRIGKYNMDVYATDNRGNRGFIGGTTFNVKAEAVSQGQHKIQGTSQTNAQQLYNYYVNTVGLESYPQLYIAEGVDLYRFCELYVQICQYSGLNIKTEVAFAQMCHETNYLKFTGDVNVAQHNFAGLGATGGVPGNSFASIETGIMAHVQHLYCYASVDSLPAGMTNVDPRWAEWIRGLSATVEGLNGTWAAGDSGYDQKIITKLNGILNTSY